MKKDVVKNIRINNLKSAIIFFALGLIPNIATIALIMDGLEEWFMVLIFGGLALLMDWFTVKSVILIINPLKSEVFKKYGSVKELENILAEIEGNIEYEDNQLTISKNYVADKKDIERIVAYKDILRVHKLIHKTNFVVDRYELVITDKYNYTISYWYSVKEEKKVDELVLLIGSKCNNAKIGYTEEAKNHVQENIQKDFPYKEPKKGNECREGNNIDSEGRESNIEYACPDCRNKIQYGDKFCKECGCKIDWD